MLMADGARAIIGSINLTAGSFDSRCELAIEVDDDDILDRLQSSSAAKEPFALRQYRVECDLC
jgi:hypothetical protein